MSEYPNETIALGEVGDLLNQIAARDQRTTSKADVVAWWHDLNIARVTYRDAQAAVNRYFAQEWPKQDPRTRFRVTASAVIEIVKKVRKERIEESNFVYEPRHPDESGFDYTQRLKAQIAAVADGRIPPQPAGVLRPRPVKELIAGFASAHVLPPEIAEVLARRRPPGRTIVCPACHAPANTACRTPAGRELKHLHPTRVETWATAISPCPYCAVGPGEACVEYGQPYKGGAHKARIESATDIKEAS